MSYCRWSSDDWKSDVYAYESNRGYELHVAGNRYTSEIPPLLPYSTENHEAWWKSYQAQMEAVDKAESAPIGGEYDGKDFVYDTLPEFLEGLRDVAGKGYRVPEWVIEVVQDEIAEAKP